MKPSRKTPLAWLPGWSREIEEIRVTRTALRVTDISEFVGMSPAWWANKRTDVREPKNWGQLRGKIMERMEKHVV